MSDLKKEQYQKGEVSYNKNSPYLGIKARNEKWEQNPQLKKNMKKKTSIKNTEYSFYQYDKNTEELIKI